MNNLLAQSAGINESTFGYLVYFLGSFAVMLLVLGIVGLSAWRDKPLVRMQNLIGAEPKAGPKLVRSHSVAPSGILKALLPEDPLVRGQIEFQLAKLGFDGVNALRNFFLLRFYLALFAPLFAITATQLSNAGLLPSASTIWVEGYSSLRWLQIGAVGAAVGFYGPGYWLNGRIKERQTKIRNGFPNALDLLQISVESGLGFDAALTRVGQEIGRVSPEIAYEFLVLQSEISAGRDREAAMFDMAERMGLEEAKSFVLVVIQSLQFGTSLTSALKNYATEMRINRELAAQEKANKLPVQMSAVMSVMMLPALFLITLTPVIIRYLAMYD
jgi:tight adherence protein C